MSVIRERYFRSLVIGNATISVRFFHGFKRERDALLRTVC